MKPGFFVHIFIKESLRGNRKILGRSFDVKTKNNITIPQCYCIGNTHKHNPYLSMTKKGVRCPLKNAQKRVMFI